MKKRSKGKKTAIAVAVVLLLLIFVALFLYAGIKNFTVRRVFMPDGREIYLMGTFHTEHFERYANYSMEEMLNAVKNIAPDAVLIEARERFYDEYGVVDGPVDMCAAYCYCREDQVPVEMIDFWEVDDEYQADTTTTARDEQIHENIMEKLSLYEGKRVLVICGFGHLGEQTDRLIAEGGKAVTVDGLSSLFKGDGSGFSYPSGLDEVWEERVHFYAHTYPSLIQADDTLSEETKAMWREDESGAFYDSQMVYRELFRDDRLYRG
ncbi:MAG: hypothetical protein NC084_03705 [Bacteroides sp.]|nr:hypothetical protein [Eubacterium sp.]MCM1417949.1 hypothetical protein [Roseburia sp.]MCM1461804.1 hypothetical protein [Bacteroides sp.]